MGRLRQKVLEPAEVRSRPGSARRPPHAGDRADDRVLELQRMAGNQATLLALGAQPSLRVGAVDDPAEREADEVARRVAQAITQRTTARPGTGSAPRSAEAVVGTEGGALDATTGARVEAARRGGNPLDEGVRRSMETALGADLGAVRLHDGPEAADLNARLGSEAFTLGSDVFFRGAPPDASRPEGAHLLAHELTHTIQQGGAGVHRQVIRRFTFDEQPTPWQWTQSVKRSSAGATGVLFFEDMRTKNPGKLVVKATKDPVGEMMLNDRVLGMLGVGKPQMRVASETERAVMAPMIEKYLDTNNDKGIPPEDFRKYVVEDFKDKQRSVYIMGMVKGQDLESIGKAKPDQLTSLLEQPEVMRKLGRMHAADLFLGNADRLVATNLGNVMATADDELVAIDNWDAYGTTNRFGGANFKVTAANKPEDTATVNRMSKSNLEKKAKEDLENLTSAFGRVNGQLKDWPAKKTFAPMLASFIAGMKETIAEIIAKLAPKQSGFSKWWSGSARDQQLKQDVKGGELGDQGWKNLKARAEYLRKVA